MKIFARGVCAACVVLATSCGARSELVSSESNPPREDACALDGGVDSLVADVADSDVHETARDSSTEAHSDGACQWTFADPETYTIAGYPAAFAIGDFDGDGHPDILTAINSDATANNLMLLVNQGDGTFAAPRASAAGLMPWAMATGDWNGDGSLDVVILYEFQATGVSTTLSVFLNHGDGTFAPPIPYPISGGGFEVVTADFNVDGHPDLALIDANDDLSVLLNQGDGTFGAPRSFDSGGAADHLTTGDFNHDGAVDIAVAGTFSVSIVLNQGDGTFAAPVSYPNTGCDDVGPIAAGDLNGDGVADIVRSCWQAGDGVAVRINRGDGTFAAETAYSTKSWWPFGVVVGDFLGQGRNGVAAAGSFVYAQSVSVLPGVGDGTLGPARTFAATNPNFIATGDLNGDGHPDLATAGNSAVSVLLSACQ
jgi:hypothetical protein